MSCCPTCPENFSVKNIPDEVECLIAKKLDAEDGALNLNTQVNFLQLFNDASSRIIDSSTNDITDKDLSGKEPGLYLFKNNANKNGLIVLNQQV